MTEGKNFEFPTFIVSTEKRKQAEKDFNRLLSGCQKAYSALKDMPDIGVVPQSLAHCTAEWVDGHIDGIIKSIGYEKTLTRKMKDDAVAMWNNIRGEAKGYVSSIQAFVSAYPDAEVTIEDGKVVCSKVSDAVTESAKEAVPDGCAEHYDLIMKWFNSLQDVMKYQEKTGVIIPIHLLNQFVGRPESLAAHWIEVKKVLDWQEKRKNQKSHIRLGGDKTVEDIEREKEEAHAKYEQTLRENAAKYEEEQRARELSEKRKKEDKMRRANADKSVEAPVESPEDDVNGSSEWK